MASFNIIILCQDHLTHPMSTTGALSSTTAVPSGEFQVCFSPVLFLSPPPLAFLFPFLQRHMATPFKNVKSLSAKMLQFVCPGLGSQNFQFLRLPIRHCFQLCILLPERFTCFQVVRAHARCSLVKKGRAGSLSLPLSGPGSMENEGSQSKWRTSKTGTLLKLRCQNGWNKDPQRKLEERNFKEE